MEQKDWTIAMEGLVDHYSKKCEELQSRLDAATEMLCSEQMSSAELRKQLAVAQNDVKQLRQSRDKRTAGCAARDDGVVMAALAEMRGMIERMQQGGEVAQPVQDDGWIEWNGGKCPVDDDVIVQVQIDYVPVPLAYQYPAAQFDWSKKFKYRLAK